MTRFASPAPSSACINTKPTASIGISRPTSRIGHRASSRVASSCRNSDDTRSGASTMGSASVDIRIIATLVTSQPHRWASSTSFAPSAWPTRVVHAMPRPRPGNSANSVTVINTFAAATSGVPILPTIQNIVTMPAAKKTCCKLDGMEIEMRDRTSSRFARPRRKPREAASLAPST